jgi:outer membrane protein OmpA-like peptidoglycan-associated protein
MNQHPRGWQPALKAASLACALAALAACNTTPPRNARLDEAHGDYQAALADTQTPTRAPVELQQARPAMELADASWARGDAGSEVDHLAYLARQRVGIARAVADRRMAETSVANAGQQRDQARLSARTQEADMAHADASLARAQTNDAEARNTALALELKNLHARPTPRGMVITLSDVLFDTNQSSLKADGREQLDRLATFLKAYPERKALIEGFTDNVGSNAHNEGLSHRRAEAVKSALMDRGIAMDRIGTQAYGESNPVAGNDSAVGRQLNRRVEIVLSDETGKISMR